MNVAERGSIRRTIGRLSIWRVPNLLLEPRGSFLGERDETIDRLNRVRSVAGAIILMAMIVYYSGLSHLASAAVGKHGTKVLTVTANSPEGHWLVTVVLSVVLAMFLIPLVSLILVLWARPGARKATLYQLRWPFISIAAWFGIFAVSAPIVSASAALASSGTRHMNAAVRFAAGACTVFVAVVMLVWIAKALYLAATGLFRADDGHPLLAPIIAPCVAWLSVGLMASQGSGGLTGVPVLFGLLAGFGGAASITVLSFVTLYILRRKYRDDFPFRNGPIRGHGRDQSLPV